MSQLNYVPGSATAAAVSGVFNKTLTQGPYAQGRRITQVVPAGVTTMYVTGCAAGGSTIASGSVSNQLSRTNAVYDGVSYLSIQSNSYSSALTWDTLGLTGSFIFNAMTSFQGRYGGMATGASASGMPFIVTAGTTDAGTQAGLSWTTDGGYTWTQRSISPLNSSACAKDVKVSNDGRAVVLWNASSGSNIALSVTKDYGTTWTDVTATALGDSTVASASSLAFLDNKFIVGVSGAGKFRYATDPTGAWTSFVDGSASDPTSIAWDGTTWVTGHVNGTIKTSSTLTSGYSDRTSNLAAAQVHVVAGLTGNFIAYNQDSASGNQISYSVNAGVTWTNSVPSSGNGYAGGGIVYSSILGLFIAQGTSAATSHRSPTGAGWTAITTNASACAGYPLTGSNTGFSKLCVLPTGVYNNGKMFTSATATSWETSIGSTLLGLSAPTINGFDLTVIGSTSGNLLTLKGGKGTTTTSTATAKGMDGGGLILAGGKGASSAQIGGAGLYGVGGISETTAASTAVHGTTPMAGNGSRSFTGSATGGGGTIPIHSLQTGLPVGIRVPGAGGGHSNFSTNCFCGGGGGSMYSRGGDALQASNPTNVDAEGIGQGGYASSVTGSHVTGAAGGGEGCYRIPITVVPGETLTITIPGRASCSFNPTQTASCGGPGFFFMEWSE